MRGSGMELVLAVAQAEGGAERAADAAAAVAILHQYARVHADVGEVSGPSVSAHFGIAHGINAGDALSALAYLQLLVDPAVERPPEQTVAMTRRCKKPTTRCARRNAGRVARRRVRTGCPGRRRLRPSAPKRTAAFGPRPAPCSPAPPTTT